MYSVRYLHGWIQVANAADVGDDAIAVKAAAAAVERGRRDSFQMMQLAPQQLTITLPLYRFEYLTFS